MNSFIPPRIRSARNPQAPRRLFALALAWAAVFVAITPLPAATRTWTATPANNAWSNSANPKNENGGASRA